MKEQLQQLAAETAQQIFTRYLELKGMFREEDINPFVLAAFEKVYNQGRNDEFDICMAAAKQPLLRAIPASEIPEVKAAERVCRIYFDIAAKAIGEGEVRKQRDEAIEALTHETVADAHNASIGVKP